MSSSAKLLIGASTIGVIAFAVWLYLNARRSSWVNEMTVQIDRPAREVFPWLHDPDKRRQWILFLKDSKWVAERHLREVIEDHGQTHEVDLRVVRLVDDRLLETAAESSQFDWVQTYELTQHGDASTLKIRIETRYKPWLARALAPLVSRDVQSTWRRHADRLRDLLSRKANVDPTK